jgi:Zn-dependent metalloprotease
MLMATSFAQTPISIQDKNGNKLFLQMNPQTGSAHRIYGHLPNISDYGFQSLNLSQMSVEILSKKFFSDYANILKISPSQIKLKKAETDGKMWFVSYIQSVNDVPVYGTEIGYTINQNGEVVTLGADAYQNISIATTPHVTKSNAKSVAKKAFSFDSTSTEKGCELVIYPKAEKDTTILYLTWKITLFRVHPLQEIIYFVDAQSGTITDQKNNLVEGSFNGQVKGSYWPVRNYDPTVQAGFKTTSIKVWNNLGQLVWNGNSDANGNYSTGTYAYTNYYVQFTLQNEWVQVRDAANNGNPITAGGWCTPPATVNQDWGATDGTSVRWLASAMHDYFKNTFGYSAMDYQMGAYINALDQYGNPRNGAANGTDIFFGTQNGQQWVRSSDVVYHEYTHNTVHHIYGGWIGDPNQYYIQATAMDEGLSDYFASTVNNDPILGEDVGVSRNLYNNNYKWDTSAGAHWNGQVIGGACWDLRQSSGVGQTVGDNLVFRALQISPRARTFSEFEYNVFVADYNYYSNAHSSQILQAFSNHGIYSRPLAYISGPTALAVGEQGTWAATATGGTGSYTYAWYFRSNDTGGQWYGPLSNTNSYTTRMYDYDGYLDIRVDVTSGGQQTSATRYVLCTNCSGDSLLVKQLPDTTRIINSIDSLPQNLIVEQNYPNPFNPSTVISYQLSAVSYVTLKVYDILGREVAVLADKEFTAGKYEFEFDASNLPSGTYIYRLRTENKTITKKMLLIK